MADLNRLASGAGADELAGFPSRELGIDIITGRRGSHQFLGDAANHHNDQRPWSPRANKVLLPLPLTSGPAVGKPNQANPLGAHAGESVTSQ